MRGRSTSACAVLLWVGLVMAHNADESEVLQLTDKELITPGSAASILNTLTEQSLRNQGLSTAEQEDVKRGFNAEEEAEAIQRRSVPDTVSCHWKLEEEKLSREASLATAKKEADEAATSVHGAEKRKGTASAQMVSLATDLEQKQSELKAARTKYKALHEQAMKLYYTAKGDLDGYNNERKKVNLDAAQSSSTLTTYLKYKKQFIEASADSDDPSSSNEVQHYKKLSAQYLAQYREAQNAIQVSYSGAKRHQTMYFKLSKEYHDLSEAANDVAIKVEQLADQTKKVQTTLQTQTAERDTDAAALPRLRSENKGKAAAFNTARLEYKSSASQALESKLKYFKGLDLAGRLTQLADDADANSERSQVRYLDFTSKSDDKSTEIEGTMKAALMLKSKFEAANNTAVVYMKAYQLKNCDRVAAADLQEGMRTTGETPETNQKQPSPGEGVDPEETKETTILEQCHSDRSIADANLKASKSAKIQHMDEMNHLAMVRKEHEEAVSGAKAASSVRDTAKEKSGRLRKAAATLKESSANPC